MLTSTDRPRRLRVLGLLGVCTVAAAAMGADQPQWGQWHSRNMVSAEKNLPESFDPATGKNVKWVANLGSETHASPIIAGGKILIGTNNGEPRDPRHKGDRGVVMCLDEKDGRFLWQLVVPKIGGDPYLDWPRGGIVSPPTVEGDRAYLVTNRGEVVCLDMNGMANGNDGPYVDEGRHMAPRGEPAMETGPMDADIIWLYDLVSQAGIYPHDAGHSSVLVDGQFLYVNTSNGVDNTHRKIRKPDAPSLVVLDKKTGRLVAKDDEGIGPRIFHCTWSSPAMGRVNGRDLVFFGGGDGVCYAFEPLQSGAPEGEVLKLKRVWRFDCDPTAPKENVHRWTGNRRESPSNIMSMPVFDNGRVYVTAGGDMWWGKNTSWLKCIDASKTGEITTTGQIWSYEMKRSCSTPAVVGGLVIVADSSGVIHCVDAETGRPYWTHDTDAETWGSTLVADGKVYLGTRRGKFWVLAASKEKRLLSSIELDSAISSTPTAANGVLYVSTMARLYALERK